MRLEAKGCSVVLADGKLLIDRGGRMTVLKQATKLSRQGPSALIDAFKGPNRNFLLAALTDSRDLLVGLAGSLKERKAQDGPGELGNLESRQLLEMLSGALQENRTAAVDAFRQNDDLVRSWLKNHKELLGIFLEGDIHVFVKDIESARCDTGWRKSVLTLRVTGVGDPVEIEFDKDKKAEFEELSRLLSNPA